MPIHPNEKVEPVNVAEEMSKSFLDYSMSVIISRALPDARDGLKPSQRRILYAMNGLGLLPNRKHSKCAKIVGETMGNYHPHGDMAIYPTLVHMAQRWAMREILIEGQGNFGSMDGDPPASMRYTEARLTPLGAVLMEDMEKDTVDFVPNYDETTTEPRVFPAAFPNLLVNGGTGIAVGMATNIPPHNLSEVIDGVCALIDDPDLSADRLLGFIKGPDFPTGCTIYGSSGIRQYFETGRGSLKVRGKATIEEARNGREQILITEIPFNVNRAELIKRIAGLIQEKVITDIGDVRDLSDENTRIELELKRDANAKVVLNNLYMHTAMESSFAVNMLAIDHGRPKLLSLKEALHCYIEHRRDVILRRTRFLLRQAEARAETLEGYLIALANMDDFIEIIRNAANRADRVMLIIKDELIRIKDKYGSERLTAILPEQGEIAFEDLIVNEGCIITITHGGYIKRTAESEFRAQRRGGRGVIGMTTREAQTTGDQGDFVEHLFTASTHDSLMFFTQTGRCYVEKVYEIPEMGRASKGRAIANLLELRPEEKIAATLRIEAGRQPANELGDDGTWNPALHVMFAVRSGIVKKTNLADFANVRKGGIIAIQIEQGDELIDALLTNGMD